MNQSRRRVLLAVLSLCSPAIAAPVAHASVAGTVAATDDGIPVFVGTDGDDQMDYAVLPGDGNRPVVVFSSTWPTSVDIDDSASGAGCEHPNDPNTGQPNDYVVDCWADNGAAVEGNGGGDQIYTVDGGQDWLPNVPVVIDGGDGDDTILGAKGSMEMHGGAGDDDIVGDTGNDVIDGGAGNDKLYGRGGNDTITGGDGDDQLDGHDDASGKKAVPGTDTLDGGPGKDVLVDSYHATASITLDGIANDGPPGWNDNVTNVEDIETTADGDTVTGTDGPETMFLSGKGATMNGAGGDDDLEGGDGPQTIDGGPGNDTLTGGFGDDVITGGPGRDSISGDRPLSCTSGPVYGVCGLGQGDDTIYAVDGEVDHITCGLGTDTVYADAIDVVDPDCEVVHRSGTGTPGGGPAPTPAPTPVATPAPAPTPTAVVKPTTCKVPALKGLSLSAAKSALTAAGCTLGKAKPTKPKKSWVVKSQTVASGKSLALGAKVGITLAAKPKAKAHKKG